jgi:hypothetical protein
MNEAKACLNNEIADIHSLFIQRRLSGYAQLL